jgi:hypothetical protein
LLKYGILHNFFPQQVFDSWPDSLVPARKDVVALRQGYIGIHFTSIACRFKTKLQLITFLL